MTLTINLLNQIEREAASAPASMLRLRLAEVRAGLASASTDARDYAGVLLLKLEHRLHGESVGGASTSEATAYLATWIGMIESEQAAA